MPDVFVAADTSDNSFYFRRLVGKNVLNSFVLDYFDKNRTKLKSQYLLFEDFNNNFQFAACGN